MMIELTFPLPTERCVVTHKHNLNTVIQQLSKIIAYNHTQLSPSISKNVESPQTVLFRRRCR